MAARFVVYTEYETVGDAESDMLKNLEFSLESIGNHIKIRSFYWFPIDSNKIPKAHGDRSERLGYGWGRP